MCGHRPERLSVCFGMRLVDGHGVRPQELGPRCLAKRVQAATCVRRPEHLPACFGMFSLTDMVCVLRNSPCFVGAGV